MFKFDCDGEIIKSNSRQEAREEFKATYGTYPFSIEPVS